MKQGQDKFYEFILERVREDKVDEANELLGSVFLMQTEGRLTKSELLDFIPKMLSMLKLEYLEEVKVTINHFADNMKK